MLLDDADYQWLNQFTGGAIAVPGADPNAPPDFATVVRRERSTEQGRKRAILDDVWSRLDAQKETIGTACGMQAPRFKTGKVAKKLGLTETAQMQDGNGRQEHAIESAKPMRLAGVPALPRGKGEKPEPVKTGTSADRKEFKMFNSDLNKAGDEMNKVHAERDLLMAAKTKRTHLVNGAPETKEERLFTDDEITTLLYEPLVREKIIPETLVPAKFSATQKMIDGSNQYYLSDCKANGAKGMATGKAALAKDLIAVGTAAAAAGLTAIGPAKQGGHLLKMPSHGPQIPEILHDHDTVAKLNDGAIAGGAAASFVVDTGVLIDDILHSDASMASSWQAVLNDAGLAGGKIVAIATGNPHWGLAIADGISGVAAAGNFAAETVHALRRGEPVPVDVLFAQLGAAVAAPLRRKSDLTGAAPSAKDARLGDGIEPLFKSVAAAFRNKLGSAITAGDWKTVRNSLIEMLTLFARSVPNEAKLDAVTAEPGDFYEVEKRAEGQGRAIDALSAAGDAINARSSAAEPGPSQPLTEAAKRRAGGDAKLEELFKQKREEFAKTLQSKQRKDAEAIEAKLMDEQTQFEASLASLGGGGEGGLAQLLAALERDQKTWDMAFAVIAAVPGVTGGVVTAIDPASEALGPIKSAAQAIAFCTNLKAAIARGVAWRKWRTAHQDAENAVSCYATAIDNFASNQAAQLAQHSIQGFGNLIQTVLAVFELSPMQPAFKLAGATANALFSTEQALYAYFHQRNLRDAWAKTKEAFDPKNKGDRTMGLLARKVNPTLAKYTVAYGALIEKSPIAITTLNSIGITRDTLANEKDGVVALKAYLEKLYPEDGVVTGLFDPLSGEKAPPPALTVKTWAMTYLFWTKHFALVTENPAKVTGLLGLIEPLQAQRLAAKQPERAAITAQLTPLLQKLRGALTTFSPAARDGSPIAEIQIAMEDYVKLVDAELMVLAVEG